MSSPLLAAALPGCAPPLPQHARCARMIAACSASARQLAPSVQQGRVVPQRAQPALHGWLRFPAAWLSPAAARFARSLAAVVWLSSIAAACGCRSLWALRLLARPARPVPARVARCAQRRCRANRRSPRNALAPQGLPEAEASLARTVYHRPRGLSNPHPAPPTLGAGASETPRCSQAHGEVIRSRVRCSFVLVRAGVPPLGAPFPPAPPFPRLIPPCKQKGC